MDWTGIKDSNDYRKKKQFLHPALRTTDNSEVGRKWPLMVYFVVTASKVI